MSDEYTTVWETYRQRVTQALTELHWHILEHDGTEETWNTVLQLVYEGVTGHTRAWLCATLGVQEPADVMSVTRLYMLWLSLKACQASNNGWPILGYQPGVPARPEAEAEIQRLLAWERDMGIEP